MTPRRRILALLMAHRWPLIGGLLAILATGAFTAVVPLLLGVGIDALDAHDRGGLEAAAAGIVGLAVLGGVTTAVGMRVMARIGVDVETDLRATYFRRLQELPLDVLERFPQGQLVSRGTVDLRVLRLFIGSSLGTLVQAVTVVVVAIVLMVVTNPLLTLLAVAPLPFAFYLSARFSGPLARRYTAVRAAVSELASQAVQDVEGAAVIRGFARENEQLARFRRGVDRLMEQGREQVKLQSWYTSTLAALSLLGLVAVLLYGSFAAVEGHRLSTGEFVAFYGYLLLMLAPAQQLGALIPAVPVALAAGERALDVIDLPDAERRGGQGLDGRPGSAALRDATLAYGDGPPALQGVELDVPAGSVVALTGPTGSGKTTVLQVLLGLRGLDAGEAEVGGVGLENVELSALRGHHAAEVDDDPFLFAGSVRDNIAYARPDADEQDIEAAARTAQAHGFVTALPDGYATRVGARGIRLSGGERQRIALARALLIRPRLVLLDNATGSLDGITERRVVAGLRERLADATAVTVAYRESSLALADEVMTLRDGRVVGRESRSAAAVAEAAAPSSDAPAPEAEPAEAAAPAAADPGTAPGGLRLLALPRRRMVAIAAWAAGSVAVSLVAPLLAGAAVDEIVKPKSLDSVWLLTGAVAVTLALTWVTGFGLTRTIGFTGLEGLARLRVRLVDHLLRVPLPFVLRSEPGALLSRVTNDVEASQQLLNAGFTLLVTSVLTLLATMPVLLILDLQLGLVTLVPCALAALVIVLLTRAMRRASALAQERLETLIGEVQETVSGARVVRGFSQQERHVRRFDERNDQARETLVRATWLSGLYPAATELIGLSGIGAVLLVGGDQVLAGAATVGTIVTFTTYLRVALAPLPMLATLQSLYVQAAAGLSRIAGLLAVDAEEPAGRPSLDPVAGEVRFEGVSFAYPGGPWVVRDVDLTVPAGGTLALVGKTGAGKTTLIRLLMGFLTPGRGRVRIDGHDLATVSLRSLREHMAVVTQEPFLFRGTVADNLAWAAKDHAPDRVQAAAHAVGLLDVLPRGQKTEVSERGANLSAGQRQLVALARALVAEPRLLILDEATSSVDPASEARVEEAITVAAAHCTTVIVAHRLSTIRSADEIAVLDAGRVVERGAHDDLLRAGGAYARLYHAAEGTGITS